MKLQGYQWRAMNSRITIFSPWKAYEIEKGHPVWAEPVVHQTDHFEKIATRFSPYSELNRFCHSPLQEPVKLSCLFHALLQDSIQMYHETSGWFNPFLGGRLQAFGYDRSFEHIGSGGLSGRSEHFEPTSSFAYLPDELPLACIDEHERLWVIRQPINLDFGGIGKGWLADRIAKQLQTVWQVKTGMVDAGGDLTVWGEGAGTHPSFGIEIQDPHDESQTVASIRISSGAIATSNRIYRHWHHPDGKQMNHIINPFSGHPADGPVIQASVFADRAMHADVWAKCLTMMSPDDCLPWIQQFPGARACWLILEDGRLITWKREEHTHVGESHPIHDRME